VIVSFSELAGTNAPLAAIKLEAAQRVSVNTYTDGALSEAGLKQQANPQAGFLSVTIALSGGLRSVLTVFTAISEVAVLIKDAIEDVEAAEVCPRFGNDMVVKGFDVTVKRDDVESIGV